MKQKPTGGRGAAPTEAKRPRGAPARGAGPTLVADEDVALAPVLANVVGYLLRRAHNAFQTYWMMSFRHSDVPITPVQGGMLVVLASNPGLTQTALARMMNVEGPTLMQSIDRLEQRGYLQRVRRPGDRRSYSLQLTPRGREALDAIEAFLPLRDEALLADLSPKDIEVLSELLTRIVNRGYALQALHRESGGEAAGGQPTPRSARAG
jgi:DNA-binding MarR family transcriptional regulator